MSPESGGLILSKTIEQLGFNYNTIKHCLDGNGLSTCVVTCCVCRSRPGELPGGGDGRPGGAGTRPGATGGGGGS